MVSTDYTYIGPFYFLCFLVLLPVSLEFDVICRRMGVVFWGSGGGWVVGSDVTFGEVMYCGGCGLLLEIVYYIL